MVYFQTNNTNLGEFWRVLQWKMLVYLMGIWSILQTFGIFRGNLVHVSSFGMLYQDKSGNLAEQAEQEEVCKKRT
jgi:hypothetical protein